MTTDTTREGTRDQSSTPSYNVAPALMSNKITDGDEFVLIRRSRQSEQPQVFSTGDQQETQQWLEQVTREHATA